MATMTQITSTRSIEGTIITFNALDIESGDELIVAADHRPGQAIIDALDAGEFVEAFVPEHMILKRSKV